MNFDKGYIGVTAREWFNFLCGNEIIDEVNFWRKNTANYNSLAEGQPFFFLVKNENGVKTERAVRGYGLFNRYEVHGVDTAWSRYGVRNGDPSRETFEQRMKAMFEIEQQEQKIGCIILSDLKFFNQPVYLSTLDIEFQNSIVSGKGITASEVESILESAASLRLENDTEVHLPPLNPRKRDREFKEFSEQLRDMVVYSYLFKGMSHRELDDDILEKPSDYSRGYFSMGLLHHLGVEGVHKGLFRDKTPSEALQLLLQSGETYRLVYESLSRHIAREFSRETIVQDLQSEDIENGQGADRRDGGIKFYYGKRYERDPENRRKAIEIHGLECKVCGFNFEKVYGARGKDYIEIHHIKPLSTLQGEAVNIEPETDLVPVCSNCHRMIHRRHDDVLTVEQLKEMICNRENVTIISRRVQ